MMYNGGKKMTKVAIYCRVSTEQQELEQQVNACKKFCEFKGFEYDVYAEVGSGKQFFTRPEFVKMLGELKKLKYKGVVVFRFDRLGRNMKEAIEFFEEMERRDIQVYSLNESFDTSTAMGRAIRDFILRLAQLEREGISEATKQRLAALKASGKPIGRPKGASDRRPRRNIGYLNRWDGHRKRNWMMKKDLLKTIRVKNEPSKQPVD